MERYITPERLIRARFGPGLPSWETVVLVFHGFIRSRRIVSRFDTRPFTRRLLSGTTADDLYETTDFSGLIVSNIGARFGCGPTVAALVEELAYLGVQRIIGIGCAGSINREVPRGTQFILERALVTDGTAQRYGAPLWSFVTPDQSLLRVCRDIAASLGEYRRVTGAQVDAIYQETPQLVREWRSKGADVINMEVSTLYSAAAYCGVPAVYLGHVSDELLPDHWDPWTGDDRDEMVDRSADLAYALAKTTASEP